MRKLVCFLITLIIVLTGVTLTFGGTSETTERDVTYETVEIVQGDTLWEICEEYRCDGESTQECVERVMEFNNMHSDAIRFGQKIIVPVMY
ncbi:MAG: LysM peptidoglycan-binding domain-containing protein [Firmicutes bacterium]|nr:LysM peptidoglycan-binding domain-containing protein [Bacillota bacterium]